MKTVSFRHALAGFLTVLSITRDARACDLCALYTAIQVENPVEGALRLGVAEQFTDLDRIQRDGRYVANSANQYLKSSVTQVTAQYDPSEATSLQLVLPVIGRSYRRIEDGVAARGSDVGIGDVSLLAHYVPLRYADGDTLARLRLFAGVELPTGDAHRLGEESAPGHHGDEGAIEESDGHADEHGDGVASHALANKHNGVDHGPGVENAIHGHDLALGSGSFDFPLGAGLFTQWNRFIFASDIQYNIRTEGAYSYRYANDWVWGVAVGRYLYLDDDSQIALRARLSGQYKDMDTGKGGAEFSDTAFNGKFLGPEITAMVNHRLQGLMALDIPVDVNNSDLQITPGYRLRAALTYRF